MKIKTRMTKLISLCMMLALTLASTAHATNAYPTQMQKEVHIIQPRYEYIEFFRSSLQISNSGVAECAVTVRMNTSENYTMKIILQRQVNGSWYDYATWDYNGSTGTSIKQSKTVVSGYNYRVQATIEFADETEIATSSVVYY
ncbi:hypothetical protein RFF05_14025 [Bengtsoniella intestinalis]|uniref:hypothetical protein n=1 Tax=Bengtsoniella intestinalis TaxID=3073143 RepID=UPI00391EE637